MHPNRSTDLDSSAYSVLGTSFPNCRTSRRATNVRHTEMHILFAAHGQRRSHHDHQMREWRTEQNSIPSQATITTLSSIWTPRLHCDGYTRTIAKTNQGHQYICVLTDWYFKQAQAIPMFKTSSTYTAIIFLDHWIVSFGIPAYLLPDSSQQFVRKFLMIVR